MVEKNPYPDRRRGRFSYRIILGRWAALLLALSGWCCLVACAVNPVTGKKELSLVSKAWEVETGREQYLPARQMGGGDYVTEPEVTAYVQNVGRRVAAVSDRQLPYEFAVVNDGTPNAWALPGGKIAVHRGLLAELQSEAELAAVLSHEVVHAAARHGAQGMQRGLLLQGAVLAAGLAAEQTEYAGLVVGGAQLAAILANQRYSREAELEADYYGMQYMARANYDPEAAVRLQETFLRLAEGQSTNWLIGLFSSHPPSQERVAENRQTARALGDGGEVGRERYAAAIAPLLAAEEAYADYERGRKSFAEGDLEDALALAEQALGSYPREALFHELRGVVRAKQGRWRDALVNYDRAIERNPAYFRFFLRRGLARKELGNVTGAERDLLQSAELLPTAPALNALGQIHLARGERARAKEYFAAAAGSDSEVGRAAAASLLRLDLPERPGRYLSLKKKISRGGYLVLELANPTSVSVRDVVVQLVYVGDGRKIRTRYAFPEVLRPGSRVLQATALGPVARVEDLQNVRLEILRAAVVED